MKGRVKGVWESKDHHIEVRLDVITFNEDNNVIMYCPALEITGYGADEQEAKQSFEIAIDQFFLYTTRKKSLAPELKKLGWRIRSKNKPYVPPTMSELLVNNDNFNHVFNNYSFKKMNEAISMPV